MPVRFPGIASSLNLLGFFFLEQDATSGTAELKDRQMLLLKLKSQQTLLEAIPDFNQL